VLCRVDEVTGVLGDRLVDENGVRAALVAVGLDVTFDGEL